MIPSQLDPVHQPLVQDSEEQRRNQIFRGRGGLFVIIVIWSRGLGGVRFKFIRDIFIS